MREFASPWSHSLTTEEITSRPWRQGGHTGRAIYCGQGDGAAIGWMDTPALTAAVVATHNAALGSNWRYEPDPAALDRTAREAALRWFQLPASRKLAIVERLHLDVPQQKYANQHDWAHAVLDAAYQAGCIEALRIAVMRAEEK